MRREYRFDAESKELFMKDWLGAWASLGVIGKAENLEQAVEIVEKRFAEMAEVVGGFLEGAFKELAKQSEKPKQEESEDCHCSWCDFERRAKEPVTVTQLENLRTGERIMIQYSDDGVLSDFLAEDRYRIVVTITNAQPILHVSR